MEIEKRIAERGEKSPATCVKLMVAGMVFLVGTACGRPAGVQPIETGATAARLQEGYAEAIREVLARDTELGTVRNHAPETDSLADAVRAYVEGLEEVDFSSCPPEFVDAFGRHRKAWQVSIEFFREFEPLRGELHALFAEIRGGDERARKTLEDIEKGIWETWKEVEVAAERYGVLLTGQAH